MTSSASPHLRSDYETPSALQWRRKRSKEAQEEMDKSGTKAALPALPVELWLEIMRHATFVPDILEPGIVHQAVTRSGLRKVAEPMHSLLYQSIIITSSWCVESLAVTLRKSRDECGFSDSTSARSLGSFTVRLDIIHIGQRCDDALHSIMRCLPNLSILSISNTITSADPQRIIDNILSCALPLRVIDFRRCLTDPRDLERLLKNSPHLRMRQCYTLPSHIETNDVLVTPPIEDTIVLPNITHLSMYGGALEDNVCSCFTFPSLHELSCDLGGTTTRTHRVQELFFGKHGHNLTSLHIRSHGMTPLGHTRDLLWIKQRCPNLRNLTLCFMDWEYLPVEPINIPAIEILGLHYDGKVMLSHPHSFPFLFRFLEFLNEASSTFQRMSQLYATTNWSIMDSAKSSNCDEWHSKSLRMQAGLVAVTVITPLEITTAGIYATLSEAPLADPVHRTHGALE
ncbi:hypothetical protein PAXINDRAFT_97165 [Paxillus involutus ATCC 200175]|nr:hypothetical protein PAXINDRAFT_97165 [Paxillus involutus ATCC 200175]